MQTSSLKDESALLLLQALDGELSERRNSIFAHYARWRDDPLGFITDGLLGFAWSKQREICESVRKNRRTAVQSCHDVGKDWIAAQIVAWWESCNGPGDAFAVTLAPTAYQVKAILWREINRAHAAGGLPGRLNMTEWWHGQELVAFGRSPKDTDPTAIQGIHAPKVLVVLDEACGIGKALIDASDTLIANEDSRILAIGNPDDPTTEFATICKPGSGWNVIRISAFESPNFTDEKVPDSLRPLLISRTWVEEKRKSWGEDSPLWQSKVLGLFPEQSTDSLVPITAIRAAHERFEDAADGEPNELGVDVARFGDDWSVFYRRKGFKAFVEHRHRKRDLMELVGHIVRLCRADKPDRIKIDDIGMGGGVVDRLLELQSSTKPDDRDAAAALRGVDIVPINVGEGAGEAGFADERFVNRRAEINWQVRTLFTAPDAKIALGPNDDLDAQATQIKYKVTSSGEIQIESKADMKKRTKGVSPDDWDALCLCFADPQAIAMFRADEQTITAEGRRLPGHWQRAFAFDMDDTHFGAVWAARDPHTDTVYIYDAIKVPRGELAVHKEAMVKRGAWIPGLFDMKGRGRAKDESIRIVDRLSDQLQLFTVEVDEGAANEEMQGRLSSNRFKVFDHLAEWFAEYRQLKRKDGEEVAKGGDHLMKTTAMLMLHVTDVATSEAASAIEVDYDRDREERKGNRTTGY